MAPVNEFVPEAAWCAEQTRIDTLRRLVEVQRQHPQTAFMTISYRLIQFFEYVVENGRLPSPMIKYCPATMVPRIPHHEPMPTESKEIAPFRYD